MENPTIIKGGVAVDDRGIVTFNNDFNMSTIKRFYMLENHQEGFVRAWHGHLKEAKWITCVSGVAVVGVAKIWRPHESLGFYLIQESVERFTLYPNGDVLYVPPEYANGHKNLACSTRLIHFSDVTLEESFRDDLRLNADTHDWVWKEEYR